MFSPPWGYDIFLTVLVNGSLKTDPTIDIASPDGECGGSTMARASVSAASSHKSTGTPASGACMSVEVQARALGCLQASFRRTSTCHVCVQSLLKDTSRD